MNYYPTQRNPSPAQAWFTGWLIQHLGFLGTFLLFAVLAAGGSALAIRDAAPREGFH